MNPESGIVEATSTGGGGDTFGTAEAPFWVLRDGAVEPVFDRGISAFDAPSYDVCSNDNGLACDGISWEWVNDDQRGSVLEIRHESPFDYAAVFFETFTPQDLSSYAQGDLVFELKHLTGPDDYRVKLDCVYPCSSEHLDLTTQPTSQWQTIRVPLSAFTNSGSTLRVNTGLVIWARDHNGTQFESMMSDSSPERDELPTPMCHPKSYDRARSDTQRTSDEATPMRYSFTNSSRALTMTASNTVLISSPSVNAASIFAAIDIGSNSFHLIIARLEHGEVRPIEVLAEKVQLGRGLEDHQLHPDSIARGLACLERFQQLIQKVKPHQIRVVGTNALRRLNRHEFTEPAEQILGAPVDVIYGHGRLVWSISASPIRWQTTNSNDSSLISVVASTEFIIGRRFEAKRVESLQLGCVSYSERFFPDGLINEDNFELAYDQARLEVSHIRRNYKKSHWEEAIGSSGTLQAIELLVSAAGWIDEGIDYRSLRKLEKNC